MPQGQQKEAASVLSLERAVKALIAEIKQYQLKEQGKGLSTEDFTTSLKTKLNALPTAQELTQALTGKASASTVSDIASRLSDIEAIIGSSSQADSDNIINKVVEMINFFATITEEKTLAGMLASLKQEILDEIELEETGFRIEYDEETELTTIIPTGTATIEYDEDEEMLELTY